MLFHIALLILSYPSLLNDDRLRQITRDGSETVNIMGSIVSYVENKVTSDSTIQLNPQGTCKFHVTDASGTLIDSRNTCPNTYDVVDASQTSYVAIMYASGYGVVSVKRFEYSPHVNSPLPSPPPAPSSPPPSAPPLSLCTQNEDCESTLSCCNWDGESAGYTEGTCAEVCANGEFTSSDKCRETHDYIVVGSGAGGSVAAAYLRKQGANFTWLEAGGDESDRLQTYAAVNPQSKPTDLWEPVRLVTNSNRDLRYQIPRGTGGMTSHYVGVNYWTLSDTMDSLQMMGDDLEALEFVVNNTLKGNVRCDEVDTRYHTHARDPSSPAPEFGNETTYFSFPMCLYGRCNASTCRLNDWMAATIGLTPPETRWHRQSSYIEYGGDFIRLYHNVTGLRMDGKRIVGVRVRKPNEPTFLVCSSRAVLLAAGVMGNARILRESYPFFAQPVIVHINSPIVTGVETCDQGSISGGTLHHQRFLSTFAACTVNGIKRLVYATPQAVNVRTSGQIIFENDTYAARVNYDDPLIYNTLWDDFATVALELIGVTIEFPSDKRIQYASYHWTGDTDVVYRSKHRSYNNLYIADAMAVTGATGGWTSFNARVAGALAAMRALDEPEYTCSINKDLFNAHCCNDELLSETCESVRDEFQARGCCSSV